MGLAGLLRRHTTDHLRAILNRFSDVESTLEVAERSVQRLKEPVTHSLSGEALADDLGVLVN